MYEQKHGIPESRLFSATWANKEDHIDRCQAIDLFLDNYSYNAGATAVDALWAVSSFPTPQYKYQ